jgi:hypothetical protein
MARRTVVARAKGFLACAGGALPRAEESSARPDRGPGIKEGIAFAATTEHDAAALGRGVLGGRPVRAGGVS